MVPAIVVESLCKQYKLYSNERPYTFQEAVVSGWRNMRPTAQSWALRDVSFTVMPGQMLGVIGRNGAGKSTLLLLLGGIIKPDSGIVRVNGHISALYDMAACFHPELTGRENAKLAGVVSGLTRSEVSDRLASMIEFAELEKVIDRPLRTYSSGMRMRLGFSVAVHVEPNVLLVDECLAVGDASFRGKCAEKIAQLRNNGSAIVLISHDVQVIKDQCDRAMWLDQGLIMASGDPQKVVATYLASLEPAQAAVSHQAETRKAKQGVARQGEAEPVTAKAAEPAEVM